MSRRNPVWGIPDGDDWVEVRWPSGLTERFEAIVADKIQTVKEGSGVAAGATEKRSNPAQKGQLVP